MKAGMAKEKSTEGETGVGPCLAPEVGAARVESYITGQLTEADNQEFVNHVTECEYCLQQVVLWRMAEEVVDRDDRPQQVTQTA